MLGLTGFIRELTNTRSLDVSVVDGTGTQVTSFSSVQTPPATATLTSVAASATSVSLLASNASRRRFLIHNESSKTLFIAFAATATTTAYSVLLGGGTMYESELNDYTGAISGIWSSANGFARITEITT